MCSHFTDGKTGRAVVKKNQSDKERQRERDWNKLKEARRGSL